MTDGVRLARPAVCVASALAVVLAASSAALACPVCATETGAAVRAGLFGDDFLATVLSLLAPFPVLLTVVAVLHRGWPPLGRRARRSRAHGKRPEPRREAPGGRPGDAAS